MSGTINPLYVHGPRSNSDAGYTYSPNISISLTYSDATRTGNTASVTVSGELKSLYTGSYYDFEFSVYAKLSRTSGEDVSGTTLLFTKPSGVSSWSDGYRTFNKTLTIDLSNYPTTSAVYLQLYFSGGCDNCCWNHNNQTFVKKMTWEMGSTIPVPSSGYTVTYKGLNGETVHTDTNQTSLPSSAPSVSSKGITNTTPSSGGLTYSFKNWKLPSGYSWGDALSGNVTIKSEWNYQKVSGQNYHYKVDYSTAGNEYAANFVGYDSTFSVSTKETLTVVCGYTISGTYIGGNNKPVIQTSAHIPSGWHMSQVVGYPIRSTAGSLTSNWKPSSITYANNGTKSISNSGSITDTNGYTQNYSVSGTVKATVAYSGNSSDKHYTDFYDTSKKYHTITNKSAFQTTITGNGTKKSYWHMPPVWKYRTAGKDTNAERYSQGTDWYKDVDIHKYVSGNPSSDSSWTTTNKYKYNNGQWINSDTDSNINR